MENNKKFVKFPVFIWAIGILLTLFIFALSMGIKAAADTNNLKTEVGSQLSEIKTDVKWIKESIKNK